MSTTVKSRTAKAHFVWSDPLPLEQQLSEKDRTRLRDAAGDY